MGPGTGRAEPFESSVNASNKIRLQGLGSPSRIAIEIDLQLSFEILFFAEISRGVGSMSNKEYSGN